MPPRFVAYYKSHGLNEGDDWFPWKYMIWNSEKTEEFRKLHKLGCEGIGKIPNGHGLLTDYIQHTAIYDDGCTRR
ncbi:TPA: hypothetical protein ACGXMH_001324 [Bacillus mobilis]|uniref:hypothetical protein n=1 Tax=Bacillus mobilis TaxID=2026190 RepID=UPI0011AB0E93|nr:hypothetical protein [Bacillus mobilis]MED4384984.1 hypothetical protein [Bacillus mobilis]HDX9638994.1 hypothetical protein [Bacillus mobilis]